MRCCDLTRAPLLDADTVEERPHSALANLLHHFMSLPVIDLADKSALNDEQA